jgi:hypothetical protein
MRAKIPARAGDAAAWDVLFRRYQLPLYAYIFELVRNEQASLDTVQETFIAAVRHLDGLRDDASLAAGFSALPTRSAFSAGGIKTGEQAALGELVGEDRIVKLLQAVYPDIVVQPFQRGHDPLAPPFRSQ